MADDFNPYAAPESKLAENFIVVEPRRRPVGRFAVAVSCFGLSAVLFALAVSVAAVFIIDPPADLRFSLPRFVFVLVPFTLSAVGFFFAGRSFWRERDRLGSILFLLAIGPFVLISLGPILLP